jgi:hypothetical protein
VENESASGSCQTDFAQPDERECDVLVSTGEQVTVALLAMVLKDMGYPAFSLLGHQVQISTDSSFGRARIKHISAERLLTGLNEGNIAVVAGFQGVDEDDNITTLGRGGSDTTAVAIAAATQADACEIYTDVDGVYMPTRASVQMPTSSIAFHTMRCWSLPVSAQRCCRSVPWNLPNAIRCPCTCARVFQWMKVPGWYMRMLVWKM